MDWNAEKANEYFSRKYQVLNPERRLRPGNEFFKMVFDAESGMKALYLLCIGNASSKDQIVSLLKKLGDDNYSLAVPQKMKHGARYSAAFKNEAESIRSEIEKGTLEFNDF